MIILKRILIFLLVVILLVGIGSFALVAYATVSHPVEYADIVNKNAETYDMDPILIYSIIRAESNFEPRAKSRMGALGLMQIIPDTGNWIAEKLKVEFKEESLYEPEYNIQFGSYYIAYLVDHFKDIDVALAAYNGGIGNVQKWLKDESVSRDGESLHNIPFQETKNYVEKVNDNYYIYRIFYGDEVDEKEAATTGVNAWFQNYIATLKYFYRKF